AADRWQTPCAEDPFAAPPEEIAERARALEAALRSRAEIAAASVALAFLERRSWLAASHRARVQQTPRSVRARPPAPPARAGPPPRRRVVRGRRPRGARRAETRTARAHSRRRRRGAAGRRAVPRGPARPRARGPGARGVAARDPRPRAGARPRARSPRGRGPL